MHARIIYRRKYRPDDGRKAAALFTRFIHEVFEYGFVLVEFGIVELGLVVHHELFHLGSVVELEQCAAAPHDAEDEQTLKVHRRHLARARNQTLQQVARLQTSICICPKANSQYNIKVKHRAACQKAKRAINAVCLHPANN